MCCVTELRSEAVMQALAQNSKQPLIMPMSSKRTSAIVKPARGHRADRVSGTVYIESAAICSLRSLFMLKCILMQGLGRFSCA